MTFFLVAAGNFCCLGEYLQIISNQEDDDDDLLKGGEGEEGCDDAKSRDEATFPAVISCT